MSRLLRNPGSRPCFECRERPDAIVADAPPAAAFSDPDLLAETGLDRPRVVELADALAEVSLAEIRIAPMRTGCDNDRALLNTFDPRVVLLWSVPFVIVPWLFYDTLPLAVMLAAAFVLAALSQVGKYLLGPVLFGQLTTVGFFVVIGLAVFSAMSSRRISQGMLRLGVPRQLTFAITDGYRMMPLLVEEHHDLTDAHRLRSKVPEERAS